MRTRLGCALLLTLAGWTCGTAAAPAKPSLAVKEVSLGEILRTAVPDTFQVSPDCNHLTYLSKADGKCRVVLDGKPGTPYDDISADSLTFSPDGARLAYVATVGSGQCAVCDGVEGARYDALAIGSLRFSPDSKHFAYAARKGPAERIVLDGAAGPACTGLGEIVFSPNGRPAYVAGSVKSRVVLGDVTGKGYDGVSDLVFSPDGARLAYVAADGDTRRVVVDGVEGPAYDSVDGPVFSRDGKRLGYAASRGSDYFVIVDGKEVRRSAGYLSRPVFSPDGKRVAFVATKGAGEEERATAVVDGVEGKPYDEIGASTVFFSPESTRVAYLARRGRDQFLVVDGIEGKPYESAGGLLLSRPVVAKGKVVAWYKDMLAPGREWRSPFSPTGSQVAYLAGSGRRSFPVENGAVEVPAKLFVVTDRAEGPDYDVVGEPVFSPDGRHIAYLAMRGEKRFLVLDGVESKPYDSVLGPGIPVFTRAGVHFLALRGRQAVRVEAAVPH